MSDQRKEAIMDEQLVELVKVAKVDTPQAVKRQVHFSDDGTADLEIERDGEVHRYTLKPLNQLFVAGSGAEAIDLDDNHSLSLLMTIEHAILVHDDSASGVTDGQVALTLRALAMNPESDCGGDALAVQINRALRLFLSLNDCSRQEVKLAMRKVLQSVQWHNREAGVRGYLNFIREHIPRA